MKKDEKIYGIEDYFNKPKEQFVFLKKIIDLYKANESFSLLDLGCARGEFLYFLHKHYPATHLYGIDGSQMMIEQSKQDERLKLLNFSISNVLDINLEKEFDFINVAGLISYLKHQEFEILLEKISKHLNSGGYALLFGIFNENDIDVEVEHRNLNGSNSFEHGRNSYSMKTINELGSSFGMSLEKYEIFDLSIEIEKSDNLERNWTVNVDGKKMFMNGMGQVFNLYCVVLKRG